jgi:lysophospholipase L1-like esterase
VARVTIAGSFTDDERRQFVRYTDTGRWPLLERFPISADLHTELLAQMLASTPETIRSLLRSLHDETEATATRMLTDDRYREALAHLPFRPADRVVAVGDSVTADRLGWFELLAASLRRLGAPTATMINLGVSGNTTADVLERFDLLEAAKPSRVLLMLGTNDARAHGRSGSHRMVTADQTQRNLRALADLVTEDLNAHITLITPPAVDQERVDAFFSDAPLRWHASDVAEVADAVRKAAPGVIDLHQAMTARPRASDLLEPDGVHPTPAGQQFILNHIIEHLRIP